MELWDRVSGVIKDKNSVVFAKFPGKTSFRNPVLETAVINATSHDGRRFDKRSAEAVFSWIRSSPISPQPLVWALSRRMEKTRSWVVAIKGLMLMHGVLNCKDPAVQKIGRLPFDLSTFSDEHLGPSQAWGFNAFIREYHAFLDQRALISSENDDRNSDESSITSQHLSELRKWQFLLHALLQVKPRAENMKLGLILEAMDCIIVETYDVHVQIRTEITNVLLNLHPVTKSEAAMALKILRTATAQSGELASFHEFCKEFGVLNAGEIPAVTQIPVEKVVELERIVNGVLDTKMICKEEEDYWEERSAIVEYEEVKGALKTVVTTDKWVGFDDN